MEYLGYADKSFIFNNSHSVPCSSYEGNEYPWSYFNEDWVPAPGDDDSGTVDSEGVDTGSTVGDVGSDEEGAEEESSTSTAETESVGESESGSETESETETESESESETETESESESQTETESESESETEPESEYYFESMGGATELTDVDFSELYSEIAVLDDDLQTVHNDLQVISSLIVVFIIVMLLEYVYKFFRIFF
jgi:serine-aspartate repeat-containing protein C/D/E